MTRDEIHAHLWGTETFVDTDLGLNCCVNAIRSALRDSPRAPRYIETLPKRGYRFVATVEPAPFSNMPTLAVLPFDNLNRNPDKAYFADGVTDALITQLGRISGMRVISRQSVLHLRGCAKSLREIARELGADAVVEGAVLHAGDRVRISAQLIRTEPEGHQNGLKYLQGSIALDPGFAPAWTTLAHCYSLLGFWGHIPPRQAGERAREAAAKALALDDSLARAHAVRAWIVLHYDWDLGLCDSEIHRALELVRSDLVAHSVRTISLMMRGAFEEGLAETRETLRLDPVSPYANANAAWFFVFARRFTEARRRAREAISMFPQALQAWYTLGWAEVGLSKYREAVDAFEKAAAISRDPMSIGYLGHALALSGRTAAARDLLGELLDRSGREHAPPKAFLCLYAGLGDIESAFEWVEKAYHDRDGVVLWLDLGTPFDPLREDPRFAEMLRRLGLPPPRFVVAGLTPAAEEIRPGV